ncbi:sigma-70 family RNA polymerase sigma factor [Nocardioides sp. CFH 31398]|uniref:sigma-70 family RNA polymerase sigma factor n=1 Tax=Nocardioides sp. CFH 31398 TaxID=2919579 RepID=UPI001F06707D|nr:sigma-70 family RNA polymerase sigma factor [Nocardioides sp. CFH 31398]MCH1867345.1 sigma-70 family RNA polymerase sigma factor [Nocardioides sp. CFH 31398]
MRETAEFDDFYAGTAYRVVGHVYAVTGDLAAAEDAVAEAYLKAWARWSTVRGMRSPEAWVRCVATRDAVSRWRVWRNRLRAHDRAASDATRSVAETVGPDHVALVAALQQIPAAQRVAVVLHHLVGLSVAEIADEVGAPAGTVKARLSRGRTALARLLDPEPPPDGPTDRAPRTGTEELTR